MLVADAAALAALHVVPLPMIQLMGGISPEQDTVALAALLVQAVGWLSLPVWVVSAAWAALSYRERPTWTIPETPDGPTGSRAALAFAGLACVAWLATLPITQPEQLRAHRLDETYRKDGPAAALALMSSHARQDFPASWRPPPRRFPGHPPTSEILDMLEALAEHPPAEWVRDLYVRQFRDRLLHDFYEWPEELLGEHAARLAEILSRLREGPELAQALQGPDRQIETGLGPYHDITETQRVALESVARLARQGEDRSNVDFAGAHAGDQRHAVGITLCWCPPGTFRMGSPPGEPERRPGEDQVEVRLTRGFWIGRYEVTQSNWRRVVGPLPGELTAELPEGDDYPVGNVNFAEAEMFCRRLTGLAIASRELPEDWEFRLPTEAQWEYACRAGTTTATAFGDSLGRSQANFGGKPYNGGADDGPSLKRAAQVGSYAPNKWGIHDMHGNTFEWCRDWYHATLPGGDDPELYAKKGTSRVRRGGAWTDDGWPCRSAFRLRFEPDRRYDHIGFRVVAVRR
jgi:formylglycine-generating enzyme required for sulfatase activity